MSHYPFFIVLTSDNLWLRDQTLERIKKLLSGLMVAGSDEWDKLPLRLPTKGPLRTGLVLLSTKNVNHLNKLAEVIDALKTRFGGTLPAALIIDDEADQASPDTGKARQAKRRARGQEPSPDDRGSVNRMILELRGKFPIHTYLQVTATPQALLLQERSDPFRPQFTLLIEPGKGYTGGNTFFALVDEEGNESPNRIRPIPSGDLDLILDEKADYQSGELKDMPASLVKALCTFYVGATIKLLQHRKAKAGTMPTFALLCHISEKKADHDLADKAIAALYRWLNDGLSEEPEHPIRIAVTQALERAYQDLFPDGPQRRVPNLDKVITEMRGVFPGTDIQVLNSSSNQREPRTSSVYNILIGGTKLSRGVTLDGLIVTYYGRRPKRANMDTMLQHARMYGYRERDLDVTRLFMTPNVEQRFRLINQSEQGLREVVRDHPDETFRGILIGDSLRPTRNNVYNPYNVGAYAGGRAYFPSKPCFEGEKVARNTAELDRRLRSGPPENQTDKFIIRNTTIDEVLELLEFTQSDLSGSGLYSDAHIVAALEKLKFVPEVGNQAHLIVVYDRNTNRSIETGEIRAVLSGGEDEGLRAKAAPNRPTVYMLRQNGRKEVDGKGRSTRQGWAGQPFWMANVQFPPGAYGLIFNFV